MKTYIFTSTGNTCSWLCSNLKGEFFCKGVFTYTISKNHFLNYRWPLQWVFLQYREKRVFYCFFVFQLGLWVIGTWTPCWTPVRKCSSSDTSLANYLPWSLICFAKQSCLHISSSCFVRYWLCFWPLTEIVNTNDKLAIFINLLVVHINQHLLVSERLKLLVCYAVYYSFTPLNRLVPDNFHKI